jgi:hypothetical protein
MNRNHEGYLYARMGASPMRSIPGRDMWSRSKRIFVPPYLGDLNRDLSGLTVRIMPPSQRLGTVARNRALLKY